MDTRLAHGRLRPIPTDGTAAIGDFRRYPGCRLLIQCSACSWSKTYNPERVIDRLRELKAGGYATQVSAIARRIGWNCPACSRMRWRAQFAWPPEIGEREARRLTQLYRN
jgi:hypothetical protein